MCSLIISSYVLKGLLIKKKSPAAVPHILSTTWLTIHGTA